MAIPGSLYYVQFKEDEKGFELHTRIFFWSLPLAFLTDGQALYKRSYPVSNDRTIMVSPLIPGKTYITVLVAGDGIWAETKSDPQYITTLGKGKWKKKQKD